MEESLEEENLVEEVLLPKEKSQANPSRGMVRSLVGSMFEISTMTEDDITRIHKKYYILSIFYLHASRLED